MRKITVTATMEEGWRESLDNINKNCISRLQEYAAKRGLDVRYEETFPSRGGFGYDVYFVKYIASGSGCRKQVAKETAADRALRTIYRESGNNQQSWQVLRNYVDQDPKDYQDGDYDDQHNLQISTDKVSITPSKSVQLNPFLDPPPTSPMPVCKITSNVQSSAICSVPEGENPISTFMEYAQSIGEVGRIEEETKCGPPHHPVFTVCAYIGTRRLAQGTGGNKNLAKRKAAEESLNMLSHGSSNGALTFSAISFSIIEPLTFHDRVAKLCHEKFDKVVADIPVNLAGRKVIAGVVMETKTTKTYDVISIASGNRFINGSRLTTDGQVVIDSHAEILANRGMRSAGTTEVEHAEQHHPTFDDAKQGLLRTKMEQGEGQIPSKEINENYQSLDNIKSGERLRIMSCSDKICKWNLLGTQGALLANMIKPVYFASITLGTLYNEGHMARAMCCRLEKQCKIPSLTDGYKVNHPLLGGVSRTEDPQRSVEKSTAHCINWNVTDDQPELTDGTTGLPNSSGWVSARQKSLLCKVELLRCYKEICMNAGLMQLVKDDYLLTKNASKQYQRCKKTLYTILNSQGYGTWTGVPRECQGFSTSTSSAVDQQIIAKSLQWPRRDRNTITAQTVIESLQI